MVHLNEIFRPPINLDKSGRRRDGEKILMKTAFFCQECGYKSLKWMGRCSGCGAWNSLIEETVEVTKPGLSHPRWEKTKPRPITEIKPRADIRTRTGIREFDRILGGGIVAGSLVLVGGEPGIGKSTLLLQVSNALSVSEKTVLYVSGEESVEQSKLRAERLGASSPGLFLVSETNLDLILEYIREVQPALVMNTISSNRANNLYGSCIVLLLRCDVFS